jgi:hypothetical protein
MAANNERLTHDVSWVGAITMTEKLAAGLTDEQQKAFFHDAYCVIRAAIQAYCTNLHREQQRLHPSRN